MYAINQLNIYMYRCVMNSCCNLVAVGKLACVPSNKSEGGHKEKEISAPKLLVINYFCYLAACYVYICCYALLTHILSCYCLLKFGLFYSHKRLISTKSWIVLKFVCFFFFKARLYMTRRRTSSR